jgi:type IV secretory pathway VirB10-like protein
VRFSFVHIGGLRENQAASIESQAIHPIQLFFGPTLSVGAQSGSSSNDSDIIRALRNGASDSINQTGQQIVQRQLNIAPTLTIRPGFPVRVIVTRDLVLEPYGG